MNCIIIDDEPLAIKVIESYCESISSLTVLNSFTSALDAIDYIKEHSVDLIFTDIEMPHITGIDFMKSLEHTKPIFIFTTAYPQYALDGFELNAIDYLVKPIPFPRFLISVERAKEKLRSKKLNRGPNRDSLTQDKFEDDFIFVKSEYESLKILIDDIKYIQGLKDYLKIHTISSGAILTLMNFKDLLSKLPNSSFMRIHRSYVINISKIEILQRKKVIIDGEKIPIGESYKADFYKRIGL